MMAMPEKITLGSIGKPFGVRGWAKIHSYTEPASNIFDYQPWLIRGKSVRFSDYKVQDTGMIVLLEQYSDRDSIATLTNAEIAVYQSELPAPAAGEYYWIQLIGLSVFNTRGVELGKVDHLMNSGASDIVIVKGKTEYWIPLISKRYQVDLPQGRLTVEWHEDDTATGHIL